MADKKSAVTELMEQGKLKGKLTAKEITDALEEMDFDPEQLDKFYDSLESSNIEILDDLSIDDDFDIGLEDAAAIESDAVYSGDGINIDDPVKVYLKEIGRVPLLSADDITLLDEEMNPVSKLDHGHTGYIRTSSPLKEGYIIRRLSDPEKSIIE